jgi:hypothetical protein
MLTINQLTMQRITPRDRRAGDCFIKALTFCLQGRASYDDIETIVMREQSQYNPYRKSSGVYGCKFLGEERRLYGKKFVCQKFGRNNGVVGLSPFINFLADNPGIYLVVNKNHAFAVKDGQVFDGNPTNWIDPVVAWKVLDI